MSEGQGVAPPIETYLASLHAKFAPLKGGEVATYIPELGKADPKLFGLAVATVDGAVYAAGDADQTFTIQSVSKPFMYGLALEQLGREAVLKQVGVEPTGAAFNAAVFDEDNNRAANPMVNAGAIVVSAMVQGKDFAARRATMLELFSRYAGRRMEIDQSVFRSERDTGDRNRAIAAIMRKAAMLKGDTEAILDLYFSQCSVLVNCRDLALMAAALANDGVNPRTGQRVLSREYVHDVLTVMHSCGMYNYAGQWSYEVGVPAKSGVAGAIIGVIPGQMGLAAFSPPLDKVGNSVRGIAAFKEIAEEFGLHAFRTPPQSPQVIRRELTGEVVRSNRRRPSHERAILADEGRRIGIMEAQGALYFGPAERLVRRVSEGLAQCDFLVLDLRRVYAADIAGRRLLEMCIESAKAGSSKLLISGVSETGPLADFRPSIPALFPDSDAALEWCEDQLIAAAGPALDLRSFSLSSLDAFRGLSKENVASLEAIARPFSFEPGQAILKEGDEANLFFVLAQGRASVRLKLGDGTSARVASLGAGAIVGEMALLDGGRRSADVIADERALCYGFSMEELRARDAESPGLMSALLFNLAADLAERLRGANSEIRALKA